MSMNDIDKNNSYSHFILKCKDGFNHYQCVAKEDNYFIDLIKDFRKTISMIRFSATYSSRQMTIEILILTLLNVSISLSYYMCCDWSI